jgi:hypothetical protein
MTSSARSSASIAVSQPVRSQYPCDSMHAFGKPVVPEVYWKLAMADGSSATARSSDGAPARSPASSATVRTSRTVPTVAATDRTRPACSSEVSTSTAPESASTKPRSDPRYRALTGTAIAPAFSTANQLSGQSGTLPSMIATRSPGRIPCATRTWASRLAASCTSAKVSDAPGKRRNSWPPQRCAASRTSSPIVPQRGSGPARARSNKMPLTQAP